MKIHCVGCEGGVLALEKSKVDELMNKLAKGWQVSPDYKQISVDIKFKNYYETMSFVNAVAWMAHYEGHHPDLEVGYNHCLVRYTTHAIDGLSENDFICAKQVDEILQPFNERLR
jgi:4a-hydroxytetrahydrobiopterin dehydratase